MRAILTLILICFVAFCGWLIADSGFFETPEKPLLSQGPCILLQQTTTTDEPKTVAPQDNQNAKFQDAPKIAFRADDAPAKTVTLGSSDPGSGFKFSLKLTSKGAAIERATLSEYDNRDHNNPQPLVLLSPGRQADGSQILSMANRELVFVDHGLLLRLNELHWKTSDDEKTADGSQTASFEALIRFEGTKEQVLRITRTYKVTPGSYLLECDTTLENLTSTEQKIRFDLYSPFGIGREGFRSDMRKFIGAFVNSKQEIYTKRLDIKKLKKPKLEYAKARLDVLDPEWRWWRFWESPETRKAKAQHTMRDAKRQIEAMELTSGTAGVNPIWIATTNKYFAAILRLVPDPGESQIDWFTGNHLEYYDPDLDSVDTMLEEGVAKVLREEPDGDETILAILKISPFNLAPKEEQHSERKFRFQLYIGPKNKNLFDKDPLYLKLGFAQTIDFMTCCCPASIINPLAFGILALMKWMHGFIGNYGVVIIILVFLFRLCMHPVTKKSQVSMSKMSKLAPKAEEIKKKYADNKAEMNKQMMALYKEQGASPIMGMLPMFIQMPIWIALWSAVYTGIELRGAPFLPFWITDLSVPDALYRFPTQIVLPLLGWKIEFLSLLPILMGLAFYLQQKMMPSQAAAATSPQAAQQQKIMMIMLPVLFPLMLYKAPSGVNLYIMASTFAGVVEQYVIRKHIREKEEDESKGLVAVTKKTGGKVKKKKPKPFFRF